SDHAGHVAQDRIYVSALRSISRKTWVSELLSPLKLATCVSCFKSIGIGILIFDVAGKLNVQSLDHHSVTSTMPASRARMMRSSSSSVTDRGGMTTSTLPNG